MKRMVHNFSSHTLTEEEMTALASVSALTFLRCGECRVYGVETFYGVETISTVYGVETFGVRSLLRDLNSFHK